VKRNSLNFVLFFLVHGALFTWGRGKNGRLGLGNEEDSYAPVQVMSIEKRFVVKASCGSAHTLVLDSAGQVYSFGRGSDGALGLGSKQDVLRPTLLELTIGHPASEISCGYGHSAVIVESSLFTFGWAENGASSLLIFLANVEEKRKKK
jgi:alpha-tubulin suppressor-like RCC1 family protein